MRWARGGTVAAALVVMVACGGPADDSAEDEGPCHRPIIFPRRAPDELSGASPPAFYPGEVLIPVSATGRSLTAYTLTPPGMEKQEPYVRLPTTPGEYRIRSQFYLDRGGFCTREDPLRVAPSRPCSDLAQLLPTGPDAIPRTRFGAIVGMMPGLTAPVRVEQVVGSAIRFDLTVGGAPIVPVAFQSTSGSVDVVLLGTNANEGQVCASTFHVEVAPTCVVGHPSLAGPGLARRGWTAETLMVKPNDELDLSVDDAKAVLHVRVEEGLSGGLVSGIAGPTARYTAPMVDGKATLRAVVAIDGAIVCVARQVLDVKRP